jgi:hypothetical protein
LAASDPLVMQLACDHQLLGLGIFDSQVKGFYFSKSQLSDLLLQILKSLFLLIPTSHYLFLPLTGSFQKQVPAIRKKWRPTPKMGSKKTGHDSGL